MTPNLSPGSKAAHLIGLLMTHQHDLAKIRRRLEDLLPLDCASVSEDWTEVERVAQRVEDVAHRAHKYRDRVAEAADQLAVFSCQDPGHPPLVRLELAVKAALASHQDRNQEDGDIQAQILRWREQCRIAGAALKLVQASLDAADREASRTEGMV